MAKYTVTIREITRHQITLEAASIKDAYDKGLEEYGEHGEVTYSDSEVVVVEKDD